jgi:hypothetical protein
MTTGEGFDLVQPNPGALIESLRAFGYSPETAVADLVDNSITAEARNIDITFSWSGSHSRVVIADDGRGMTMDQLVDAMRAGSTSPSETRAPSDLGRFGLGLKTASFSQGRVLTVLTKTVDTEVTVRRWDLDEVVKTGEWRLLHGATSWAESLVAPLAAMPSGTVVVWEDLDRLVGASDVEDLGAQRQFFDTADRVSSHLSMTFHRFLNRNRIKLRINNRPVDQWDPFLEGNPARQVLGVERIHYPGGDVEVNPFVLPHRSKLSEEDFRLAGGARGWNDLQGFYVYRQERLLVAGDWLGLRFTKEEHYKLARIRVDIPNSTDEEWQIDVRKSVAIPPAEIRLQLNRIAKFTRERAVEVYRHRGKVLTKRADQGITALWQERVKHGRISYQINRDHPVVATALDEPSARTVRLVLRLIEETVPVPLIAINNSERTEEHSSPLEDTTPKAAAHLAEEVYLAAVSRGMSHNGAKSLVMTTDPFHLYPELVEVLDTLESRRS